MPTMADITVKKSDTVTNVTYNGLVPSAGDGVAARWRVNALTTYPSSFRPTLEYVSKPNQGNNARFVEAVYKYPVIRVVDTVDTKIGVIPLRMSGTLGSQFTDAEIAEAVDQFINLLGSTLGRDQFKAGYSAT